MKKILTNLCLLIVLTGCATKKYYTAFTSSSAEFKGRYASFLEEGEVEINSWYHYVTTKNRKGEYIIRTFFPETKKITSYTTHTSIRPLVQHGLAQTFSDEGLKRSEGYYINGKRKGEWVYFHPEKGTIDNIGIYKNGEQEGLWKFYDKMERLISEVNYSNGLREGDFVQYDTLATIVNQGIYKADTILQESNPSKLSKEVYVFPMMYDCGLSDEEKQNKCSQEKMLQFIYKNIRYPGNAREYGIEGTAVVRFYIDVDGNVKEPEMLKSLCQTISDECIRVVSLMPNWYQAGTIDGVKTKMIYNLPIRFRLE